MAYCILASVNWHTDFWQSLVKGRFAYGLIHTIDIFSFLHIMKISYYYSLMLHRLQGFTHEWPCSFLSPVELIRIMKISLYYLYSKNYFKSLMSYMKVRVGLRLRHGHHIYTMYYLCAYKQFKVGLIKIQHS